MRKHLYPYFLYLISFCACDTIVDIDIPIQERKLAIQSLFHPDSTWKAYVSHSNHILDVGYYENLDDATVTLFEDGQDIGSLQWDPEYENYYSEHLKPLSGKTYRIEVETPKYEPVSAMSYVPGFVPIKSLVIDTANVIEHSEYQRYYKMTLVFEDPQEINFYEFDVTSRRITHREYRYFDGIGYRDSVIVDTADYRVFLRPVDPSIETHTFGSSIVLLDDIKFNGVEYTLETLISESTIKEHEFSRTKIISVRLTCMLKNITEEKFLFEKTLAIQRSVEGDPFAEPMPVFNNINNGLGIFAGYQQDARVFEMK